MSSLSSGPGPAPKEPFPYEELLAYYRGDLRNAERCAEIRQHIEHDPRWNAHWESIQYLDLERAAAIQDAADLARFSPDEADAMCRKVAETNGEVLRELVGGAAAAGGWSRAEWSRACERLVYLRRMRRMVTAELQAERIGEKLLRDWLLEDYYLNALRQVTGQLQQETGELLTATARTATAAPIPEVPFELKVMLRDGEFVAIENGQAHQFREQPRGRLRDWQFQLTRSQTTEAALLAEGTGAEVSLSLERALPDVDGRLQLRISTGEDGAVRCAARVERAAEHADTEAHLRVAFQGADIMHLHGRSPVLEGEEQISATQYLPGSLLHITLESGGQTLVELSLSFDE